MSVEWIERVDTAPIGRDGAHQTLSRGQAACVGLAGLLTAIGVALSPIGAMTIAHHLFFAVFLLGALTRLAAACTPLPPTLTPSLADEDLPAYTLICPLYREAEVVAELVHSLEGLDYPRGDNGSRSGRDGSRDTCRPSPSACAVPSPASRATPWP
ncbi:hypothetical protein [Caulobacter sp. FWC2]|uniref:hypothetical protein n=1 Tax=Caulobacter sp. FWC2 TaxID=69664 RepID=UPI001E4DB9C5|nr:hypothetical protein [Caulobacter sp. FWC2]